MIRPCDTCSLPTTGTLFSAWQAITHALHPVHTFKSILIPHCCAAFSGGCVAGSRLGDEVLASLLLPPAPA